MDSVCAHGPQVLAPGDQVDLSATPVQCRSDVGADRAGSEDCDFHGDSS
jgi:hypothetical protein